MNRIIITTNGLNRSGYRILTEGIDMTAYLKNPVMFYDHNTYKLPIGKWSDISIEDGVMSGVPVFDEKDEEAMKIKQKFEDGYLNAASLHVKPLEYSDAPEHLLSGQRFETITKSEMLEISIVGIPGLAEAVRLSADAKQPTQLKKVSEMNNLKAIAMSLGLAETATEAEITTAIEKLNKDKVDALVTQGIEKGLINDANNQSWVTMAANNYDAAKAVIDAHVKQTPIVATPTEPAAPQGGSLMQAMRVKANEQGVTPVGDRADWNWQKWEEKDASGLAELRKSNPAVYDQLAQGYYKSVTGHPYEN